MGRCSNDFNATYQHRRKRWLEKYLAGTGRAVQVDRDLQRSLSSNESSILLGGEDLTAEIMAKREKRAVECSRGCPVVLKNLAKTFHRPSTASVGTAGL